MDSHGHKTAATSTGHEVHICSRCKWPFPNPHPSAKHRRAHKRVCGTVEGYKLIHSEEEHDRHLSISDDEHASDSENHTPSPNLVKKKAEDFASGEGAGAKSNRSEDDVFSDAVTEFSDSGISPSLVERLVMEENPLEDDDPIKTAEKPDITEQVNDPTRIVEMNLQPNIIKSDVSREIAVESQSLNESDIQREEDKLASITLDSEKGEVVSVSEPAFTVQHESLHASVTAKRIPTETVCENAPVEVKEVSVDEDKTTIEFKKDVDHVEEKPNSVILETVNENGEAGGSAVVSDAKILQELSKTESSDNVLEKPVEVLVQSQVIVEGPKNILVTELKEDNNTEVVIVSEKTLDQPILKEEALPEKQCSNETSLDVEESFNKLNVENVDYKNLQDKVDEVERSDSLEGNCGSVSGVAETNSPSPDTLIIETNSEKQKIEVETFEPPSFMTLVQSGNQDKADEKEGWFPSLTNVSKESEGRKKNEEIIAKVTNSSPMKQRHGSLKTLLDEVNSPNKKQVPDFDDDANQKNGTEKPNKEEVNGNNKHVEEWDSPAKYPIEIKKEKKTKKGKPFWVPFMCCSSAASREV
ncbi:hypothetical protein ABFS82_07G074700 [Erythranthe guttata]|uniref:centromere protein F isoform X2 n=1 Tax=Erythranthe guttata TaxID=4155 RepID=UPI00064DC888|nr:PREDICTED: centromere protein F isoform X2 [Erythranthe guttata]|eukprot:XP_012835550.1 PREDICTED: centromere protein F isoform X2 [Erythranthe guttata]